MNVKRFRKLPVEIMAVQWDGTPESGAEIVDWINSNIGRPSVYSATYHDVGAGTPCIVVATLEGNMIAIPGDYVIRGVKGEFYPCKPDVFTSTYEEVCYEA